MQSDYKLYAHEMRKLLELIERFGGKLEFRADPITKFGDWRITVGNVDYFSSGNPMNERMFSDIQQFFWENRT